MIARRKFMMLLAASVVALPNSAAAGSWKLLGRRTVRLLNDRDVIPVTFLRGTFRRIQIRVRDNAVFFNYVVLTYGIGTNDLIPIKRRIKAGGQSRVIDLRGGDRIIRSIQLSYRSAPNNKGRATVEVWGWDD